MLIQTRIQINPKDYEFVKKVYKNLRYKSIPKLCVLIADCLNQ